MLKLILKYNILLCLLISSVYAKDLGNDVLIDSDSLTYNKSHNSAVFSGKVVLKFQDIILKTSIIEVLYKEIDGKNKIDKVIIPNKLSALNIKDQNTILADSAEFIASKNELIIKGNVLLSYNNNILRTKKLVLISKLNTISNRAEGTVEAK